MEMVPGILPLTSSWLGEVTSASAMSALVSDTRAIDAPVSTIAERPTSTRRACASTSAGAASALLAAIVAAGTAGAWAYSVVERKTAMIKMTIQAAIRRLSRRP